MIFPVWLYLQTHGDVEGRDVVEQCGDGGGREVGWEMGVGMYLQTEVN